MGLGQFGLGCQCCGEGGGGDDETCENNCLEMKVLSDDDFIWQSLSVHTIDLPQVGWCTGVTKRITVRGYSELGLGFNTVPGGAGIANRFGGGFNWGYVFPMIEVQGKGGVTRIVAASHNVANVVWNSPATPPLALPYTFPGIVAHQINVAFDIPYVNYADPFDWTVWLDVELMEHEIVCGLGPTRSFLTIRAGVFRTGFAWNDHFSYFGFNGYPAWMGGYRCDCPLPV